jgi:hypothetical protein
MFEIQKPLFIPNSLFNPTLQMKLANPQAGKRVKITVRHSIW